VPDKRLKERILSVARSAEYRQLKGDFRKLEEIRGKPEDAQTKAVIGSVNNGYLRVEALFFSELDDYMEAAVLVGEVQIRDSQDADRFIKETRERALALAREHMPAFVQLRDMLEKKAQEQKGRDQ